MERLHSTGNKKPLLNGWQAERFGTEAMEQIMLHKIVEVNHGR